MTPRYSPPWPMRSCVPPQPTHPTGPVHLESLQNLLTFTSVAHRLEHYIPHDKTPPLPFETGTVPSHQAIGYHHQHRVGDGIAPAVLPHHRTCSSIYGGSCTTFEPMIMNHQRYQAKTIKEPCLSGCHTHSVQHPTCSQLCGQNSIAVIGGHWNLWMRRSHIPPEIRHVFLVGVTTG